MKRFTDEGDIITVCDKCGTHLDKPNNIGWIMATVESVDMFGIRGPQSGIVGVKDVLELCWSCYYELCGFRYSTQERSKKMKLMVARMDDVRAALAQRGITGSDVDAAIAALPAWDLMTTKAVTITDYVRGLDVVELEQFLNALVSEYVDYGDGWYISLDETKWVLDRLAPSEVAEALAAHKGGE